MSIFWGREFAFVFPFYVRKYTIDRWIVVYTVCASVVISPLRQWLDSYAKLVWKCVTRSGILFICNTFCCWLILLSSLYIELALVCCADPGNVHCFGTIFPNLNFVFVSICAARPVHIQSDQYRSWLTVKERRAVGAATKTALWHWVREMTWYLYTRGMRGRMKAKQRWFQVTRELCHEWFHVRYYFYDGHWTG